MIQRNGFVSNSSSSSFVLIVPMSAHERAMMNLTDFERAVINFAMKPAGDVLPIMYCHDLNIMDDGQLFGEYSTFEYEYWWPLDEDGDRVRPYDVLEKYKKIANGFSSKLYDG